MACCRLRILCVTVVVIASPLNLAAQITGRDSAKIAIVQKHDVAIGLAVVAAAAGVSVFDEGLALSLQRPSIQSNGSLRAASNVFNDIGVPGSLIVVAGTYFLGLAKHSRPIASLGMHTGEAVVLGGVLGEGLQMVIGRARPEHDLRNSHDFKAGRGFSDDNYTSLPSTHVSVAFAAATAATREVSRSWPCAEKFVRPLTYGLAGLVGISRMYKNKHWASDVVAAAGLGTYAGILFDRFNQRYPGNVFDRVFLPSSIVPAKQGFSVTWSFVR